MEKNNNQISIQNHVQKWNPDVKELTIKDKTFELAVNNIKFWDNLEDI